MLQPKRSLLIITVFLFASNLALGGPFSAFKKLCAMVVGTKSSASEAKVSRAEVLPDDTASEDKAYGKAGRLGRVKVSSLVDHVETFSETRRDANPEDLTPDALADERASGLKGFIVSLADKLRTLKEQGPSESLTFSPKEVEYLEMLRQHKVISDQDAEKIGEAHVAHMRKALLPKARRAFETSSDDMKKYLGKDPEALVERWIFDRYHPKHLDPEHQVDLVELSHMTHDDDVMSLLSSMDQDSSGNRVLQDSDPSVTAARKRLVQRDVYSDRSEAELRQDIEASVQVISHELRSDAPLMSKGVSDAVSIIMKHGDSDQKRVLGEQMPKLLLRLFSSSNIPSRFQMDKYKKDYRHSSVVNYATKLMAEGPSKVGEEIASVMRDLLKNDPELMRSVIESNQGYAGKNDRYEPFLDGVDVSSSPTMKELSALVLVESVAAHLKRAADYEEELRAGHGNHNMFDGVNPAMNATGQAIAWFEEAHSSNLSEALGYLPPKFRDLEGFSRFYQSYKYDNMGRRAANDAGEKPAELLFSYQPQAASPNEYLAMRNDLLEWARELR